MFIYDIVLKSFKDAFKSAKQRSGDQLDTRQVENKRRSADFVECLACELRRHYQKENNSKENNIRVLSKQYSNENYKEFGLNELLYDVLVCKIDHVSAVKRTDTSLTYVTKGIWAIESEMAKNTREALYDFNKLLLSSCESKLFVGPLTSYNAEVLELMSDVTNKSLCYGTFHFTLIPHPDDWEKITAFNQDNIVIESLTLDDLGIKTQTYTSKHSIL